MTDQVWKRDEIESPCIKICVVHPETRLCTGCNRSIDEISQWSKLSAEVRAQIMAELPTRAPMLKQRRGGRAARLAK
ncbi:DUF1289 domain-containing protein [Roseobacter sp. HKCCD9010]|uniref:DUF1289 domain-containing protein n=1 Tax=unclassified Roseobacter TaxID=196798 RepID=UPI00149202E5|nr:MULTISPECIES: DUF1289 domain-containing protein [unclassified Roseobacter]MBF9050415.1 DUF1289 domain-containing protein [Rhodobacterales bacterium HKCCD4356]NNV12168.1 DUF1289 domain-containing protein [Roseobacter sp. HKCCD7357]NNV17182.1 DUF1289 domain-containing protein [Roseobacter sp. HKCCD8768]NNV26411.1 DUF1289 domain-containing protein [Roseobacter sp. HKCCD8192]NNV30906.1 DUF1289 domain-containing protein [Roseobacter sp. HKCCD9061]